MSKEIFSKRHGYRTEKDITIREDAPEEFRYGLLDEAEKCGMSPSSMRSIICGVLRKRPDPSNWSNYPNIWQEVQGLISDCEWSRVYDICEKFYEWFDDDDESVQSAKDFSTRINDLFEELGIGWKLEAGKVVAREVDGVENLVEQATTTLKTSQSGTAQNELQEARHDLSRRPNPDITGAIQHCMAALECVTRQVTGEKNTFGTLIKKYAQDLDIPRPLDSALEKIWGYASNTGRHLSEGIEPKRTEAELLLGLTSVMIIYLSGKDKIKKEVSTGREIF